MHEIEVRNLSELVPHPLNPRSITEERYMSLRRKVRRWGQLGLILIDGRDKKTILGGNHVFQAMKDEGQTTGKVEYRYPKDDAEAIELMVVHNEHFARWVEQDLAEILHRYKNQIDLSEYQIDLSKLTDLKKVLARYGETDEDEAPPLDENYKSELGKVYQLGRHRLMCGDATNQEHVARLMNGNKANVVVTDPPYGVSYEGAVHSDVKWDMIKNDDLRGNELQQFLTKAFSNIARHAIPNLPLYSFYASSTHKEFQNALELAGFSVRQQLIWVKHMVLGNSDYHWTHEPILYCGLGKEKPPFFGDRTNRTVIDTIGYDQIKTLSKDVLVGLIIAMKNQSTAIKIEKDTQHYAHPTQKPVAIMTPLIKNSTGVEEIVVDLFCGSGTTLIAAHQLDRICYAMEFDPKYADVIRKRYAKIIKEEARWEEVTPEVK